MKRCGAFRLAVAALLLAVSPLTCANGPAITGHAPTLPAPGLMSVAFRDAPIQEVLLMLARSERVNIVLHKGVAGNISVSLFDVDLSQVIEAVAQAGGYAVERPRQGEFVIVERAAQAPDSARAGMEVRSYKVHYSSARFVGEILQKHLTRQGKITPLVDRRLVVIEDTVESHERVARLLKEIDVEPKQIMIEAKILEITLDESDSFGLDWSRIFSDNGTNRFGIQGLAARNTPGFFFNIVNRNIEAYLSALNSKGRVHTLSTPKLLALEHQEAHVVIGERIGYKVTTTINLVTSETVQFLETGVILRVTPSVDDHGRVLMKIHPEVSSGSISNGVPSKKSTEVTTQLVANDGQSVLIGGLIKGTANQRRSGIPLLGNVPVIGWLLSNNEENKLTSETVVLITPHLVKRPSDALPPPDEEKVRRMERGFLKQNVELNSPDDLRSDADLKR